MRGCPGDSDLEVLASRDEATAVVRRHVARCAVCQNRLETVRANDRFLSRAAVDLAEAFQDGPPPNRPQRPLPATDTIPGYHLVEEISRGGQGVVYRAIQADTRRPVAIKMLLAGAFASERQLFRFERETELAAGLRHPNIVTIFQSGAAADGGRYVAMEFVQGVPLDRFVEDTLGPASGGGGGGKARADAIMRLMLSIANGVGHAHTGGVIHRDIKPSNILVDQQGVPRVLDFGLARSVGPAAHSPSAAPLEPMTESFAGTPAYAAPERLNEQHEHTDARGDVYSLGVVLYRLLTGHAPYPSEGSMAAVARHAAETEPTPPMRYAPRLPMDIQTIVLRCLAKDPQRRYANASALAEDIEAYLNGNPISARRDSTMYVLRKLVLRNRAASAAIALVAMTVLLAAVGFALLAAGLDQARREGERALSDSTVQRARLMAEGGDGEQAEALLWGEALRAGMTDHEGLYSGGTDAQLRSAWSLMEFYTRLPRVMRADMPEQGTTVGFSADSSSVWAIDTLGSRRTWSLDGRLLACEPGPPLQRGAGVGRVSYGSANGRYVVFESDGKAATWDIDRGRVLGGEIRSSTNLLYSYIDDHGTTLLSIHEPKQGRIRICDMRMGSVVAEFDDAGWYYSLQHDLDGLPVVLIGTRSSSGRRVLVRRPPDWQAEVVVTLDDDAHGDPVQGVRCPTLSPDGTRLAFAVSSTVMVYDISGDPFLVAKRHMMAREIERIAFHVSGQSLTVADRDGLLMNLALPDLDRTCTFATNRKTSALALSPTSDLVVVAPQGSGIAVYEPANTPWLERVASTPMTHTSIACAADGTLAWGDDAGTLHVRSPLAPHSITSIPLAHKGVITSVAFSPDGRKIVTAGFDGRVIVRGLDGSSVLTLVDGPNRVWCARYSPDGRTIAAGFQDGTIHVWTLDRSDEARVLSFGSSRIPMIEFGPDGRSLLCAAVSPQSEAVLLDMETGRPIHRLAGHGSNFVRAATWSLDGSIVVTSSDDRTLRVWDALSGRLVRIIPGLPWGPYDLAFHPQGRVLFAVGPGGSIIVVDPHAGTELAQLAVHDRSIFSIAVSPDGTKLITSGEDSWIGIADLDHLRSYIRGNEGYWRSAGSDTPPLE